MIEIFIHSRAGWIALAVALLAPLGAAGAWTGVSPGLEALALSGRPTLLAAPGTGSNLAATASAPRVVVVADESPEGLRFVDADSATELGFLALAGRPTALAVESSGARAYVLTDMSK